MFLPWTTVVGFFIGTFIGSFLNVVIYRLPRGLSLVQPPSHCPNCSHRLGMLDLVPLFSFLFSGRRCRYCRRDVSWRYLWVELITGGLWAAFWLQNLVGGPDPARFLLLAAFASVLVACIFIDIGFYVLPDSLNAWLLGLGLGYNAWLIARVSDKAWTQVGSISLPSAVAGALLGAGLFWGIALFGRVLFRKDALGHGDIKLARGIGAVLLPLVALVSFGLAVAVGAVLGAVQVVLRPRREQENEGEEEEAYEPESLGSLLRCGLGYMLAVDVAALFVPRLERWWFGAEEAEAAEDDWSPSLTTIPFGPYLAAGALVAALLEGPLVRLATDYWNWATGGL